MYIKALMSYEHLFLRPSPIYEQNIIVNCAMGLHRTNKRFRYVDVKDSGI